MSSDIPSDLQLTTADIARIAGDDSTATVASWIKRDSKFPGSVGRRGRSLLYNAGPVCRWFQNNAPFHVQRTVSLDDLAVPLIHRAAHGAGDPIEIAVVLCVLARLADPTAAEILADNLPRATSADLADWYLEQIAESLGFNPDLKSSSLRSADPEKLRMAARAVQLRRARTTGGTEEVSRSLLQIVDGIRADRMAATTRWVEYRRAFVVGALVSGPVDAVRIDPSDPSADLALELALSNGLDECEVEGDPKSTAALLRQRFAVAGIGLRSDSGRRAGSGSRSTPPATFAISAFPERQKFTPRGLAGLFSDIGGDFALAILPLSATIHPSFSKARAIALERGLTNVASFGASRVRSAEPVSLWRFTGGSDGPSPVELINYSALPFTDDASKLAQLVATDQAGSQPPAIGVAANDFISGVQDAGSDLRPAFDQYWKPKPAVARSPRKVLAADRSGLRLGSVALIATGSADPEERDTPTFGFAEMAPDLIFKRHKPRHSGEESEEVVLVKSGDLVIGDAMDFWILGVVKAKSAGRALERNCTLVRANGRGPKQSALAAWFGTEEFVDQMDRSGDTAQRLGRLRLPRKLVPEIGRGIRT